MVTVKIPATSANFGPGFDCLGIALNLYNEITFEEIASGVEFLGCEEEYANVDNLVYKSMKKCFEVIGYKHKGMRIKMECDIPVSRGLGSSATCVLAGCIGANKIAGGVLGKGEILNIATKIEGHPDNLAPALYGGMTVSVKNDDKIYVENIKLGESLNFCALIPDFNLSTKEARNILPKKVDYNDALFNVSRVALLIASLNNGNLSSLNKACEDRLHQNYRGELINNYWDILKKCEALNSKAVFLSGAGPTIMNIVDHNDAMFIEEITKFLATLTDKWEVKHLSIDFQGANIT